MPAPASRPAEAKPRFAYIDCTRGYAVLMVITTHYCGVFPDLPYPVLRVAEKGWFGVQLFFLASAVTLLMSWHFEIEKRGAADAGAFFIRRFFRIAPAYYLAAVLYFVLMPPAGGFDLAQALTFATFTNAWHPAWTPTVRPAWTVVPGSWSISVELTFYLLFPLFAAAATSLRRALLLFAAAAAVGIAANLVALRVLAGSYRPHEISNFLFFWFPNQMSIFALGGVLFFAIRRLGPDGGAPGAHGSWAAWLHRHPDALAFGAIGAFLALAYVPLGHYLGDVPLVPATIAVSIPLMALVLALSTGRSILVNRYAAAMGRVSFSAYLLHILVLQLLIAFPQISRAHARGYEAILAFLLGWPVVVLITFAVAWVLYRTVELPMIRLGGRLIRARREAPRLRPAAG